MRHCEAIDFEQNDDGTMSFCGPAWPAEITVGRHLVEYPQGPHIQFGRKGMLQFFAANGTASYRRHEDVLDGWIYKLVDSKLQPK